MINCTVTGRPTELKMKSSEINSSESPCIVNFMQTVGAVTEFRLYVYKNCSF